jgi:predicted enzyme related to lactoylglutathione lyase
VNEIGKIGWIDLTCKDAANIKDFYTQVTGWCSTAAAVEDYEDYCVHPAPGADPVAGICHQRGSNAEIPTQWMIYITVADLSASMAACTKLGGEIVCPVRDMGSYGTMCIIKDPAGAVAALIQPASA